MQPIRLAKRWGSHPSAFRLSGQREYRMRFLKSDNISFYFLCFYSVCIASKVQFFRRKGFQLFKALLFNFFFVFVLKLELNCFCLDNPAFGVGPGINSQKPTYSQHKGQTSQIKHGNFWLETPTDCRMNFEKNRSASSKNFRLFYFVAVAVFCLPQD
jgi:hypothetical protein